jgi:hypothetical protein
MSHGQGYHLGTFHDTVYNVKIDCGHRELLQIVRINISGAVNVRKPKRCVFQYPSDIAYQQAVRSATAKKPLLAAVQTNVGHVKRDLFRVPCRC